MTAAVTSIARSARPALDGAGAVRSLAVNLVLLGAHGGFLWRHSGLVGARARAPAAQPAGLSPARCRRSGARSCGRAPKTSGASVRPLRRELREAREEWLKALVAEPFDARALSGDAGAAAGGRPEGPRGGPQALCGDRRQTSRARSVAGSWPGARSGVRWRNLLDEPDNRPAISRAMVRHGRRCCA